MHTVDDAVTSESSSVFASACTPGWDNNVPIRFFSKVYNRRAYILLFFTYFVHHCFIYRPTGSTVSEDAEMKPRSI